MKTLQEQVDELLCNAFIGVCYPVLRTSSLAWYVETDEELLVSIDELIGDGGDLDNIRSLEAKGITEVLIIRGW